MGVAEEAALHDFRSYQVARLMFYKDYVAVSGNLCTCVLDRMTIVLNKKMNERNRKYVYLLVFSLL
jgi:hypothetical protein